MESNMEVLYKTKNRATIYDHAIPLLSTYSEKRQFEKIYACPMFAAVLFKISKTWKQPKCSLADEWINM